MHKKLESDLISLAHSILQMKNKDNVLALKEKSQEIYEKLSLLAFVEEYVNTTPNLKETKEELISKVEKAIAVKNTILEEIIEIEDAETGIYNLEDHSLQVSTEEILEQPFDDLEDIINANKEASTRFKDDVKDVAGIKITTLEEELKDTIPVDVMADLFETVAVKSLNDRLQTNIQIGLNDRIIFVKNLFEGSQEDFNRVVSQLNTFKTEKEAKKFINKMVKPDYNWSKQEELEARFMNIIERRFA
ncbi:hypothetical protein BTO04_07705 [Polaribacter sp. SA4-10]|uniref:hypothetical protein n=1 Tax=Polaribacter sp. SA4-10 TaxID=754397 RepID=UPI000B3D2B7A|nr:hypothetical protein [Polaribacter sp. SA4-10]ARV06592.1 hypothetical protein BTO04_07705 [Polaribacter sp. SA4-10]